VCSMTTGAPRQNLETERVLGQAEREGPRRRGGTMFHGEQERGGGGRDWNRPGMEVQLARSGRSSRREISGVVDEGEGGRKRRARVHAVSGHPTCRRRAQPDAVWFSCAS